MSLAWAEAAKLREVVIDAGAQFEAGVDVGGPGEDETVVYLRSGSHIVGMHAFADADARGSIAAVLGPVKARLRAVYVDEIGIGYHVMTHLRDLGFPVRGVNVGNQARDSERFANLKAELYWGLRERFERGDIAGVTDERTIAQLTGIQWRANASGQTVIESKEAARKRGVKSPDRAEALMLAFCPTVDSFAAVPGVRRTRDSIGSHRYGGKIGV